MKTKDFSQYGEQPIILEFLDRHANIPHFCVDVGAYEGITGSNSRALFLRGWGGLVVEPDPRSFAQLSAIYVDRPDILKLRRAVSDHPGFRRMLFCQGPAGTPAGLEWQYAQVNTFSRPFADTYKQDHGYRYRRSWVRVTTLRRALRWAGVAPDGIGFMSIDCEGEDARIVTSFDWSIYRPALLCIECDDNSRGLFADHLRQFGYEAHASTVANTLFRRTHILE